MPCSEKPKPHGEATWAAIRQSALTASHVHFGCTGIKFDSVCYAAMDCWNTCLKMNDYYVRLTVKNIGKHPVNHKVPHKWKGSLLISCVPPLLFLSCPKEHLWALVPAHSNFLPWLCACLSDCPAQLLRKAEIRLRNPWGCSPEVPDLYAYTHPYIPGFPST